MLHSSAVVLLALKQSCFPAQPYPHRLFLEAIQGKNVDAKLYYMTYPQFLPTFFPKSCEICNDSTYRGSYHLGSCGTP